MFTQSDLAQLEARGISVEKAEKQLQSFATGFPELDIVSAASVGNGVLNPSEEEIDAYVKFATEKYGVYQRFSLYGICIGSSFSWQNRGSQGLYSTLHGFSGILAGYDVCAVWQVDYAASAGISSRRRPIQRYYCNVPENQYY
jgi:hypothetical protein